MSRKDDDIVGYARGHVSRLQEHGETLKALKQSELPAVDSLGSSEMRRYLQQRREFERLERSSAVTSLAAYE